MAKFGNDTQYQQKPIDAVRHLEIFDIFKLNCFS